MKKEATFVFVGFYSCERSVTGQTDGGTWANSLGQIMGRTNSHKKNKLLKITNWDTNQV